MAARLKQARRLGLLEGETSIAGVHRMALAQLELAIEGLQAAPDGDAVHEARKAIKRLRTLDLLLDGGASSSRRRRAALRCAGRALAGARDAEVALSTLEELRRRDRKPRDTPSKGVARLHALLLVEREDMRRALREDPARERALLRLRALLAEMEQEAPPQRSRFGAVRPGVERIYRQGRRQMRRAQRESSVAEMHEWRKSVKELRYAAEALTAPGKGSGAKRMRGLSSEAERLGEALGEEHDLAMLARRVRMERRLFKGDKRGHRALLRSIERRRRRLRRRALKAGRALYAAKPRRFLRRVRSTLP